MQVPQQLVEEIVKGNAVLFVGAGLSQGAGLPGWAKLLERMLDWSVRQGVHLPDDEREELKQSLQQGDMLLVAEELKERMGKERFRQFLVQEMRKPDLKPTPTHLLLPDIPFVATLTSNYDKLLEHAYSTKGSLPPVFTQRQPPELSAALRSQEFYILKVHGNIDDIESIVLGRSDYREAMLASPHYRQYLKTLFSSRCVLFLGFSLNDPDLNLLLDELRADFKGYTQTHFALMNAQEVKPVKQRRFEKDNGIQVIPYQPSSPSHPEVREFVAQLAEQVRQSKLKQAPPPRVSSEQTESLSAEVRSWLQTIRYVVEDSRKVDARTTDLFVTLKEGTVENRVHVRCIGGEISPSDVEGMVPLLDINRPHGWLISDKRVSPRARVEAQARGSSIQVFDLAEFLRVMIWGPYFEALENLVAKDRLDELYVDIGCHRQEVDEVGQEVGKDQYSSLDEYIDGWLRERGKAHISILGEFGAGKTWFCRHYALRQLRRFLANPAEERLPLLVTLRSFSKAMTAQVLMNEALLEHYKLPFVGSAYEVFQEMNRRGKLLLILDGFDEMARQVDYQTVVDNFWALADLVQDQSKVILTSRTEYFRWARESEKVLGGQELGRTMLVLEPPRFEVIHLEPFSDEQLREVILRRLGAERGPAAVERIMSHANLAEMARKPVLVELLLAALDEVSEELLKNQAEVYLYATNKLLLRNITAEKTFTSTADKLFFLCELAWEMLKGNQLRIHFKDIPERIQSYFGARIKDQRELDSWDFDLRSQTLLRRDAAGYYEFAHKSLAEYFLAFKFAAELGCLSPPFTTTYQEASGKPCRIPIARKEVSELAKTFGALLLHSQELQAVAGLLVGMVVRNPQPLWAVIEATRGKKPEDVGVVGANALALLQARNVQQQFQIEVRNANLAGAILDHSFLYGLDLSGVDLRRVSLRSASLVGCILRGTDLREADLTSLFVADDMRNSDVSWSPDGRWLVTAGLGEGALWDTRTWTLKWRVPSSWFAKIQWDSGSSQFAVVNDAKRAIKVKGGAITLWSVKGERLRELTGDELFFEEDGTQLLVSENSIRRLDANGRDLGEVAQIPEGHRVMDYDALSRTFCLRGDTGVVLLSILTGEIREITPFRASCVFSSRTSRLGIVGVQARSQHESHRDSILQIYDLHLQRHVLEMHIPFEPNGRIAVAPDGNRVAVMAEENVIHIFDVEEEGDVVSLGERNYRFSNTRILFSPEGRLLVADKFGKLTLWDVEPSSSSVGQPLRVLWAFSDYGGLRIDGAKGLDELNSNMLFVESRKTLREFFLERGASDGSKTRKPATAKKSTKSTGSRAPRNSKHAPSRRPKGS